MVIIPQYLPDIFKPIFAAMAVEAGLPIQFDWGHAIEITRNLTDKDIAKSKIPPKYPLGWLVMDFQEDKGDNMDVYSKSTFNFIFAVDTKATYTQQQREDISYKPILLPMYASFLNQVSLSPSFRQPYGPSIKHTFLLRPYYGTGGKNIFNDICDCIEIRNLKLDIRHVTPDCSANLKNR